MKPKYEPRAIETVALQMVVDLRNKLEAATAENARLLAELDEATKICVMYKQQLTEFNGRPEDSRSRKLITRNCDECVHWHATTINDELISKVQIECDKAHEPRYFKPRRPLDTNYGWKRKCADFAPANECKL